MAHYDITLPLTEQTARKLRSGDTLRICGTIYSARDAAHKRLIDLLKEGKPLPFPIENATIYYVGPTPAKGGQVIGSAGPTTSYRMDAYAPALLAQGLRATIGKGKRSDAVKAAMQAAGAVYLGAIGGAGALLSDCIKKAEIIAFPDLGAEAIRKLEVESFPVVVIMDTLGNDLYQEGRLRYLAQRSHSSESIQ